MVNNNVLFSNKLMKSNEEIALLSNEIMLDITNDRLPLHNIMLKAAHLSLLLDIPDNIKLFKGWAQYAEANRLAVDALQVNLDAAKDPNISIASSNPDQFVYHGNNFLERNTIRERATQIVGELARLRTETYAFAMGIFTKTRFGNLSESIFEEKRKRAEPILQRIFPDAQQRLNSIVQGLASENPEDWKNAVVSCRTLIADISDILNPAIKAEDKPKTINRLKDFVDAAVSSSTRGGLLKNLIDEIKNRIEFISNSTQGAAHKERPTREEAQDTVLYTYLLIADLMELHNSKMSPAIASGTAASAATPVQ